MDCYYLIEEENVLVILKMNQKNVCLKFTGQKVTVDIIDKMSQFILKKIKNFLE